MADRDFEIMNEPDPAMVAKDNKQREKEEEALRKKADQAARAERATLKKINEMKANEQKKVKDDSSSIAKMIQKIHAYIAFMEKYFPDKLDSLRLPKTFQKCSVEELKVYVQQIEQSLGQQKSGQLWQYGYLQVCRGIQGLGFGLDLEGLDKVAAEALMPRKGENGQVVPSPIALTLEEISCKYQLVTAVEVRLLLQIVELIIAVDKINRLKKSGGPMEKASQKPVSNETLNDIKNL